MRFVLLVALVVGCGQSSRDNSKPPPAPTPRDAASVPDATAPGAIGALDRVYRYVALTPRPDRSPVEAPEELTNAYRDWIFAYGYARAGEPVRARTLAAAAKAALAEVIDDPVHAVLSAAFEARMTDAIAGQRARRLPLAVEAQLAALDRIARYKVDRLRETSLALNPNEAIDAIGAFSKRIADARGPQFDRLRGIPSDTERAKLLEGFFADVASIQPPFRLPLFVGLVGECKLLPPADAKRLLAVALTRLAAIPERERLMAYASALALAHAVDRDRIPALAKQAVPFVAPADDTVLRWALLDLVRTIGKTHRDELAMVWKAVEQRASPESDPELRAVFAAGLVQLGDARAPALLAEVEATLARAPPVERARRTRLLAVAYAQGPDRFAAIERLARQYETVTDNYGTNTHFTLSVLELVDAVVVGLVDE